MLHYAREIRTHKAILIKLIAVVIVSMLTSYLLAPIWGKSVNLIHTALESICYIIAFTSFLIIWHVNRINRTSLLLGFGFLVIAIFDFLHTYFWQGLGLFPGDYFDLATRYWIFGRFIEALILVLSTTSLRKLPFRRYTGLATTLLFSITGGFAIFYFPQLMPIMRTTEGLTSAKIGMEYIIIALFIAFLVRVYKGFFHESKVTKEYFVLAVFIAIPTELSLTLNNNISDYYYLLGHLFKVTYYYFFLRAILAGYLVLPYQMLTLSEERFQKAFEYSPVLKSIISIRECRYIDVNEMWIQTIGYIKEDVIGKTVQELNLFLDESVKEFNAQIFSNGLIFKNERVVFKTKNGVLRTGLFSNQEVMLQDEPCILMVMIDITDQVRNEKGILRLDKLNLIGQMAASLGHEIRNPMTTVRGFLQLISQKKDSSGYKEYYDIMISELDRANSIITGFLSLAKDKSQNLALHNLNTIVDDLYPLLCADALGHAKNINLEKCPIDSIKVDKDEIHQLIHNLVRNGLEAIECGGHVTIKTFTEGQETVLAIQDNGKGIDPEILDKIGTPFLTTKEQGTGLGLATCYSISARNNARIEVATSSSGTIFFVRFKTVA